MLRKSVRGITLVAVLAALWLGGITLIGLFAKPRPAALGVIFGTAVYDDGTPKPALRDRLQTGLALWHAGIVPRLTVSGAIETRNHRDEARIMAAWLEARGVPAADIIVDSTGRNTWATAQHVAALHVPSAVVVTQWFHIARAEWALRRAGVGAVSGDRPVRFRLPELWYLGRESIGLAAYLVLKRP